MASHRRGTDKGRIIAWLDYRNGPDFDPWHNLAAGLPALPGYRDAPANLDHGDELDQLTIELGIDCAEYHPSADSMVFKDVYRLILAAHTEDSADFHEQYPTSQAVDRAWIKALNTWAVLRKKVIGYGQPLKATKQADTAISARPPTPQKRKRGQWVYPAMKLVQEHPEWPDSKIAEDPSVNIDPSQLSRSYLYQQAAQIARQPRRGPVSDDMRHEVNGPSEED